MNNADKGSDIDLFIITTKKTMWITRAMVKILALFFGISLRQPRRSYPQDALCLNVWIDEAHYEIPESMRNVYTAHEVVQVIPLVNKERTFERFLLVNNWALEYWPNAIGNTLKAISNKSISGNYPQHTFLYSLLSTFPARIATQSVAGGYSLLSKLLEPFAYFFQKWYMRNHRTRELIEPGRAFFHPFDWGEIVIRELHKKLKKYIDEYQPSKSSKFHII